MVNFNGKKIVKIAKGGDVVFSETKLMPSYIYPIGRISEEEAIASTNNLFCSHSHYLLSVEPENAAASDRGINIFDIYKNKIKYTRVQNIISGNIIIDATMDDKNAYLIDDKKNLYRISIEVACKVEEPAIDIGATIIISNYSSYFFKIINDEDNIYLITSVSLVIVPKNGESIQTVLLDIGYSCAINQNKDYVFIYGQTATNAFKVYNKKTKEVSLYATINQGGVFMRNDQFIGMACDENFAVYATSPRETTSSILLEVFDISTKTLNSFDMKYHSTVPIYILGKFCYLLNGSKIDIITGKTYSMNLALSDLGEFYFNTAKQRPSMLTRFGVVGNYIFSSGYKTFSPFKSEDQYLQILKLTAIE